MGQLINKLTQINYMQQLNAMNPFNPINSMQFQQPNIYLQNQSNLIQQQMNDLNQNQTFNNPMQNRMRANGPLQQQTNNTKNINNVQQINEEYAELLAKVEAN